jgi:1-aminocyclopropane-1-carboxylate deaminase
MLFFSDKSILQELKSEFLKAHNVQLFVKRDDLIDEAVSGNKWRKLKYNIEQCLSRKNEGIITFGGAYSNHLLATASACKKAGLKSVGMVRGEELNADSNETLRACRSNGMELVFISRELYRLKDDQQFKSELHIDYPNYYIVPEGGANFYGMIGCQDILNEIDSPFDLILVAQGTTTTSCGLLMGLTEQQRLLVVPALKGFDSIKEMQNMLDYAFFDEEMSVENLKKVEVLDRYHFGGYGKFDEVLLGFIQEFYQSYSIPLDPIYTGKAMFALFDQIKQGKHEGSRIIFVHTGGLQVVPEIESKLGIQLFID